MKSIFQLTFLFFVTLVSAQNSITGTITGATDTTTIGWADVMLYQKESFIKAVITNDNGVYLFKDVKNGDYTLKINHLGYKDYTVLLSLNNNSKKEINIRLIADTNELNEVVIIAEKTTIEHKPDRKIINLGNDILAVSASASDILQELPSVRVSESGNVSLRGNQNTTILVNGKKSSLSNDKLINQLPSESILKIEIITNPSAKYQAEGLSGIINIITKRNRKKGGNINLSSGIGTGKFTRAHTDIGVNYGTKKIKAFVNYNYSERYWDHTTTRNEERQDKTFASKSDNYRISKTPYYVKAGFDVFIDSTNIISLSASLSKNKFLFNNKVNSIETDINTMNNTSVFSNTENDNTGTNTDFNINYRKEFDGSSHYIEADANYSNNPNEFVSNRITQTSLVNDKLENDFFLNESRVSTFSFDYYKSAKKSVFELGTRFEFKNLNDKTRSTLNTIPPTETNIEYAYKDGIYAGYAVYERSLENFTFKGGLRIEHTALNFTSPTEKFDRNYTDLFPSASIAYKNNDHSFSLNYSRRISRPRVWALSSIITQSDNYSQFKGNPNIQPEYANKMEINYYKQFSKLSINSSIFYKSVNDVIGHVATVDGDFLVRSMDNIGKSRDYGLELDLNVDVFKWWNTNFSTYYYFTNYKTTTFFNSKSFYQSYNLNNTIKLTKGMRIQANARYSPKRESLQYTNDATYNLNLAFSKDLFNKKGKLILRVNDVFNSHRHGNFGEVNGFSIKNKAYAPTSRHLYLTFKYNFGFGKEIIKERNRKSRNYTKKS